jgi:hypothetical protein
MSSRHGFIEEHDTSQRCVQHLQAALVASLDWARINFATP